MSIQVKLPYSLLSTAKCADDDYASSCGIPLMPVVYQVVGFGRDNGRHSGRHGRSVV